MPKFISARMLNKASEATSKSKDGQLSASSFQVTLFIQKAFVKHISTDFKKTSEKTKCFFTFWTAENQELWNQ